MIFHLYKLFYIRIIKVQSLTKYFLWPFLQFGVYRYSLFDVF